MMEGVEKALLLNSLMPSLMMLLEVSFLMWIVSLGVGRRFDKYLNFTQKIFYSLSSPDCVDNCKLEQGRENKYGANKEPNVNKLDIIDLG